MKIEITSFGRKYGVPEADVILDMRCLKNPFWVPELKAFSGLDKCVQEYILSFAPCRQYIETLLNLMCQQVEMLDKNGKDTLKIAVGCTGGRHRSVAVAQLLTQHLQRSGYEVTAVHRDLMKG